MIHNFKNFFAKRKNILIFYSLVVLAASYFTYFKNYDYPPDVFWDENYHIASAEKYLQGVMFMETHPPLGKLFIAMGEKLLGQNKFIDKKPFTQTDYIKDFPNDYSFTGVRFFSSFFSWMSAVVFFYIFYLLSKNPHTSLFFSSLYIFDNALIVHSRAAMLEGGHIFFILLTILYFAYLFQKNAAVKNFNYLILGALIGSAVMIKATGAIATLLFPFLLVYERREIFWNWRKKIFTAIKNTFVKGLFFLAGIGLVFAAVWQIHFTLGKKIEMGKEYRASEKYKSIIAEGKTSELKNFPIMLKDNLAYMANYNKGVPRLDVCKPDENGSHPMTWPLGDKSINYRWEKNSEGVRYLYLQSNPLVWLVGLAGAIMSTILVVCRFVLRLEIKNKKLFYLILVFTAMYASYMVVMLKITRVMYLYHYFVPLIFSFILAFLIYSYIFGEALKTKAKLVYKISLIVLIAVVWSYWFFSPFTYYKPLTTEQFKQRMWFDFWKLKLIE